MSEETEEGISRQLTSGEISLSKSIYGNLINYAGVKVNCASYLPFGMQSTKVAMAPNGEIWLRKELYKPDFANTTYDRKHTFIHEMAHIWQHQQGMWVRTRGMFSWAADYHYTLDKNRKLDDYSMEQQASIIADYWLISTEGFGQWRKEKGGIVYFKGVPDSEIAQTYQNTMSDFLAARDR